MISRVLILTPSCGLGGGIERYVGTLEYAFSAQGIEYQRVNLDHRGAVSHARMFTESLRLLQDGSARTRLVVAHRGLLTVASLVARARSVGGISVLCHGSDIWGARSQARWLIERRLMKSADVRVVAVSSYTAGSLSPICRATVLPPSLSPEWYRTLIDASSIVPKPAHGVHLVTAFRLEDWRDKGLPQLAAAVASLGRSDVHLTVCGSGRPSPDLLRLVDRFHCCTLRVGLTDRKLAEQIAASDLFVLATRTRHGRRACGEGFGLVLLEAQIAGTPVVGPAHGGSHDAFIDGVTGIAPSDETAETLSTLLNKLLEDRARLAQMGRCAAGWSREAFSPERYPSLVAARLL